MSFTNLDRRQFLGATLAVSGTLLGSRAAVAMLALPNCEDLVYTYLQENLQLSDEERPVVKAFTEHLQAALATLPRDAFMAGHIQLSNLGKETELDLLVSQEFVLATNFLAVRNGKDEALRLLTATERGQHRSLSAAARLSV